MAPKPEPPQLTGTEHARWSSEADEETRAAHPRYYWFHTYDGAPKFLWDEQDVSEAEFRAHASRDQIDVLDGARGRAE